MTEQPPILDYENPPKPECDRLGRIAIVLAVMCASILATIIRFYPIVRPDPLRWASYYRASNLGAIAGGILALLLALTSVGLCLASFIRCGRTSMSARSALWIIALTIAGVAFLKFLVLG